MEGSVLFSDIPKLPSNIPPGQILHSWWWDSRSVPAVAQEKMLKSTITPTSIHLRGLDCPVSQGRTKKPLWSFLTCPKDIHDTVFQALCCTLILFLELEETFQNAYPKQLSLQFKSRAPCFHQRNKITPCSVSCSERLLSGLPLWALWCLTPAGNSTPNQLLPFLPALFS